MFNREFFSSPNWLEKIRKLGAEHDNRPLRVVIVTVNGSRYDIREFACSDVGMNLFPREGEDMIVFLPYDQIGQIEVASMRDRREIGFTPE